MAKIMVVRPSRPIQGVKGLAIALLLTLSVFSLVESILINPSLEDYYSFGSMSGPTEYSFFMNHPPVLSEDEQFLLVLTRERGEVWLNMFRTNAMGNAGALSQVSLTNLLQNSDVPLYPVKLELHALPNTNYILNWMYFDGDYTVSHIFVLSYVRRMRNWTIIDILRDEKLQLDYRKLGHVKPVLGAQNMPWNLYPIENDKTLEGCQDVLYWMEDDIREFVLCPHVSNSGSHNSYVQYRPFGGCFQYLAPWSYDTLDSRHIVSVARQDDSGLIAMVSQHGGEYVLMYMGTLKNCPNRPQALNATNTNFDTCTPCSMQCMASAGAPAHLLGGTESPELLVPDSGTTRIMAYSCDNSTTLDSEPYPPWLSEVAGTDVTDCVFTIYEVSSISHEMPIVPSPPKPTPPASTVPTPFHPPTAHRTSGASFSSNHVKSAKTSEVPLHQKFEVGQKSSDHPPVATPQGDTHAPTPTNEVCSNLPPIPWMKELIVSTPLTLTLAANRTVRMSFNGDLLYATHFTRDGISSVSILDVSNGGAFEQGSLPLNTENLGGLIVNSFSDDIDAANEYLYACGFFFNYTLGTSTPAVYKYNVMPRGQPSLLSQIYIETKSGTTPTSNYMVPIPQLPGIAVVAAPREVIIKQMEASSLELSGQFITYQYTSSQVLDINVVRPVLSPDGTRILIFCQTLGFQYTKSILSAYIIDVILTPLNHSEPSSHPEASPHGVPMHHFNQLADQLDQDVKSYFGMNSVLDKEEFKQQYQSYYQNQVKKEERSYSRRERTTPQHTSNFKNQKQFYNSDKFDGTKRSTQSKTASASNSNTPSSHAEPPTFFPPQPANTPFNMTYNITLKVQCRFWISNNSKEAEVPIGASFIDDSDNDLIILAFTPLSVGFEDTQIHIYDISTCRGANILNDDPIEPSNLTIISPLATAQADISWDSLPFADEVLNSNKQSGDSSGVRFWDIPTYRLNDDAVMFWFSNQSINVGIGGSSPSRGVDPMDYSSTLLQFVWNSTGIIHVATSSPIDCSPITSQVVPQPTPLLPNVPVNRTSVWVLCQKVRPHRPSQIVYITMAWHLTAPSIPDLPLIPWNTPSGEHNSGDDLPQPQISMNPVHRWLDPHPNYPLKSQRYQSQTFFTSPDTTWNEPFVGTDEEIWFWSIEANVSIDGEYWEKSAVMNFFVNWQDRRIYVGNAESYNIIAINAPKDRALLFGKALFTASKLVNSIISWWQYPGFAFLGDVQWIWVVSECSSGTTLTETGYCSKCRPGTFGLGCGQCTAGYMCDGYGLLAPSDLCVEGYWCGPGTTRYQSINPPQVCKAGTYCPGGVASPEAGKVNSARLCGSGYYCPEGSSVPNPTQYKCNTNSTSDEGARSVDDCHCEDNYFGRSGNCRPVFTDSLAIPFGQVTKMWYPIGWYPAGHGTEEGVQYLEPCHLNPGACNGQLTDSGALVAETYCEYVCEEHHGGGGPHHKRNSGGEVECKIVCDDSTVCQRGYEGRLCSRCKFGYYERGHICSDCTAAQLNRTTTIAFIVVGAVIVAVLLGLVLIGQAFIALVLELLSMVVLNSIGLVPIWTLDILFIFVLVYFINRGKRYNTLIKLQEERALKRRQQRRAKRLAQKRREARAARSAKMTGSLRQNSARTTRVKSTVIKPPSEDAIRQTLGLPADAPLDPNDPVVQDATKLLTSMAETNAQLLDDDGPLPVVEDFVNLPSEEEDYLSEGSSIMDDADFGREMLPLDDEDLDYTESDEDLTSDPDASLMDSTPPRSTNIQSGLINADIGSPYSSHRKSVSISPRGASSSRAVVASSIRMAPKSSQITLHGGDGPAHTIGRQTLSHFDNAFLSATGRLPNEAPMQHHQDFTNEPGGHGHGDGHGEGHEGHEEHEHEPEYISEGLIKSFLFFLQTTEALSEGLYKWQELVLNMQEFSPFSQIASFDCVYPAIFTYQGKFIMYIALLPVLTLVMMLMYLLGVLRMTWQRRRKRLAMRNAENAPRLGFFQMSWANEDESTPIKTGTTKEEIAKLDAKRSRLRYRWARIWLFFVSVFYFELTEGILKVFRCEQDEATEAWYMESQPWVVCSTKEYPYKIVFPLAVTGLVVYSIGIPVLFFYLLFRHRKSLHSPKVMSWLGMLYEEYQPHLWWFEMTMIARRVLIAVIIAIVPSESEFGPIGIMMVLMAAMGCNVWFRAFVSDTENSIDLAAMCVMMITYVGGVVQKAKKDYINLEAYRRNPGIVIQAPGSSPAAPLAAPSIAANNVSIEASAYIATWKHLPAIEVFIFILNVVMFLVYLTALLRPRLLSIWHWCQHRYRDWKLRREEEQLDREAARNAASNMLQAYDDEDFDNPTLPLLLNPNRDI